MAQWSKTNIIEITRNRRIDSEFFHPDYIEAEKLVSGCVNVSPLGQLGKFIIGPFGSAFHVSNYDPNSEYRYVRGKDVKPFTLLDDDNVYMPEKDFFRLSRYALQQNDLLISVVGTLGNVAIVPENIKGIFSCKSTVFRNARINPYFLLAYFNSKYGRQCLLRRQRGAIQKGLNKEDLKSVPVPIFNEEIIEKISNKIQQSLNLRAESSKLYSKAVQDLEKKLGLYDYVFKKQRTYFSSFSQIVSKNRADADYYQIKYRQLNEIIESTNTFRLSSLCYIQKGFEVGSANYSDEGKYFIRVSNLDIEGFSFGSSDKYISDETYKSLISHKPQLGDILLTKDGTIGTCYVVNDEVEGIISSGIVKLIQTDESIPKEYLALAINSKFCQMQAQRDCSGALILHWKPEDIKSLRIPILRTNEMEEFAHMVIKAKVSKKKSIELLDFAQNEIENYIEQSMKNE
jgi:type I restriction enzyme, S subunit